MSERPELGQLCFGNPTSDYGTETYVDALIEYLLGEIERVYWNREQEEWDHDSDPKIKGIKFRPYYWGTNKEKAKKPNLRFCFSPVELRWYKYPGRGQSCNFDLSPKEWIDWFNRALKVILKADKST